MLSPLLALQSALAAFTVYYLAAWYRGAHAAHSAADAPPEAKDTRMPGVAHLGVGVVTNFFDTLGIGSFAPTTAVYKFFKLVPDRLIPGTLNVGHTLPTIVQAFIYTSIIKVDFTTLALMILASVAGAWLGAGIVAGWSKRKIQIGLGGALLVLAFLFAWRNISEMSGTASLVFQPEAAAPASAPGAGGAAAAGAASTVPVPSGTLDLQGIRLAIGLAGNFMLGAFMTLGIGMYAPCMILVGLLGMDAKAAFPIMMGSCAFLMPIASARFVQSQAYSRKAALGLAIGGIPAVLVAALIVEKMDVITVRWLVVAVVVIASAMMLRSAFTDKD